MCVSGGNYDCELCVVCNQEVCHVEGDESSNLLFLNELHDPEFVPVVDEDDEDEDLVMPFDIDYSPYVCHNCVAILAIKAARTGLINRGFSTPYLDIVVNNLKANRRSTLLVE
jgi:hypothetical protein